MANVTITQLPAAQALTGTELVPVVQNGQTVIHTSSAEAWFKAGRAAASSGDTATAKKHWEEALASTAHAPGFKARKDRPWRWRAWLALRGL